MAPVVAALAARAEEAEHRLALTGQHTSLVDQALQTFRLRPDYDLGIMKEGQSLYDVALGCMSGLRGVVEDFRPDAVLVQGDTATVCFGALVGYFERTRVGHVEAGLRSHDKLAPYPEEIFRRIARAGLALDQVEIACPRPEQAALVWEKAQRHEWPATIGPGVPIALTRPARALLAFCEWIEGGLPASRLRRMLQSGDVRVSDGDEGLSAGQAARLLARAQATWGRQTYAAALGRVEADIAEGNAAGVNGTPTVYINGQKYEGPMHPKYISLWIEEELAVNR